jgi:hypothetical protein
MAITLRKTMQVVDGTGFYIKDSSQNYAKRTFASGTNYSATSLADVKMLTNSLGGAVGTMRVNRSFIIS